MSWEEAQIPRIKEDLINWLIDHALYEQDGELVHPKPDAVQIGEQTTIVKDPVQNPKKWTKTSLRKMKLKRLQKIFYRIKEFESITEAREEREKKNQERILPMEEQAERFRELIIAAGGTPNE